MISIMSDFIDLISYTCARIVNSDFIYLFGAFILSLIAVIVHKVVMQR